MYVWKQKTSSESTFTIFDKIQLVSSSSPKSVVDTDNPLGGAHSTLPSLPYKCPDRTNTNTNTNTRKYKYKQTLLQSQLQTTPLGGAPSMGATQMPRSDKCIYKYFGGQWNTNTRKYKWMPFLSSKSSIRQIHIISSKMNKRCVAWQYFKWMDALKSTTFFSQHKR